MSGREINNIHDMNNMYVINNIHDNNVNDTSE